MYRQEVPLSGEPELQSIPTQLSAQNHSSLDPNVQFPCCFTSGGCILSLMRLAGSFGLARQQHRDAGKSAHMVAFVTPPGPFLLDQLVPLATSQ